MIYLCRYLTGSSELRKLAQALENMRIRLEGKNYIEHYVHALHELKSPIAAIRGAAEILRAATAAGGRAVYR
jgi:signal transduction histidine kinase